MIKISQEQVQQYLESLRVQKVPVRQRFRIDIDPGKLERMLKATYIAKVDEREIPFIDDEYTNGKIKKVTAWLSGDFKPGLLLYGTFGNGKTTMAKSIAKLVNYLTNNNPVTTITARDLSRKAKEDPYEFGVMMKRPKLFIDDFGWEPVIVKNWGNEISPIVEVIEERYKNLSFTILTSNKTDEEIRSIYGDYVFERITEMCDMINYDHKSYRTNKKY